MMEEIDGKRNIITSADVHREQADKTSGLTTPDLLGVLQLVPSIYSDKRNINSWKCVKVSIFISSHKHLQHCIQGNTMAT